MDDRAFIEHVARRLGVGEARGEAITFTVLQELRDRLPPKEAADVAAQLPTALRRMWQERDRPGRPVVKTHEPEFVGRVRKNALLRNDDEAGNAVRVVFAELQRLLGSPTGKEGEAWDVFSVLPKDLKMLWLAAGASGRE